MQPGEVFLSVCMAVTTVSVVIMTREVVGVRKVFEVSLSRLSRVAGLANSL